MARSGHKHSRMGRLDNPSVFPAADSFHDNSPNQFVLHSSTLELALLANFSIAVTYTGLGRDIWTVPFDDITLMFKVRSVHYKPFFNGF